MDERNLRDTPFKKEENVADFDAVIKLALDLESPGTNSTGATGTQHVQSQHSGMNIDKIEMVFKTGRVQKLATIQKMMNKPMDEVLKR